MLRRVLQFVPAKRGEIVASLVEGGLEFGAEGGLDGVELLFDGLLGLLGGEEAGAGGVSSEDLLLPGGDGGVYGALWKLGEKLRCGMNVELPQIPIAQITIEVCETVDIDPYQIPAGGSVLFVTADPERLIKELQDAPSENAPIIETSVIGYLTREAARILRNRGEA